MGSGPKFWKKWMGGVLLSAAMLNGQAVSAEAASATAGCLQGTYIQLSEANRHWTKDQWKALFEDFKKLQIHSVVLQWSVIDNEAFYESRRFKASANPVIDWIMELAQDHQIEVMVGLSHQSNHWTRIAQPDERQGYLREQIERVAVTAGELAGTVAKYRSFRGWYISEEIDDQNWVNDSDNNAMQSYLFQTTTLLRGLTPKAVLGISAFANKTTKPEELGMYWNHMLSKVKGLDIIYFQDGIGVHKLTLEQLPAYYNVMHRTLSNHKRELRPVVELFEQTSGEPISTGEFKAVPAPLERVVTQLKLAANYGVQRIAFSVPEYLSTQTTADAAAAFKEYQSFMDQNKMNCQ
jgi:hypothetical protein